MTSSGRVSSSCLESVEYVNGIVNQSREQAREKERDPIFAILQKKKARRRSRVANKHVTRRHCKERRAIFCFVVVNPLSATGIAEKCFPFRTVCVVI